MPMPALVSSIPALVSSMPMTSCAYNKHIHILTQYTSVQIPILVPIHACAYTYMNTYTYTKGATPLARVTPLARATPLAQKI
jgi:hypothetical protein